ncbi:MAG: substrate-binding domain-containing protein [Anaerolineae bacterium]|nr:substrate-binding domain-containing protein [Anaerolineae bacterium]
MRKITRVLPVLLLIIGVMIATIAPAGAQDDQLVFSMVSHGGVGNPFWIVVIKGMDDACALLGADCAWLADPVDNVDDMAGYWDDALARNPDGIGTTVPNPEVIRDAVVRADEAGIPVIVFNTADPNAGTDQALPTLFYIGANEFLGGRSNAQRVLSEAAADGVTITKGVCPIQEVGHSGLEARCAGVRSVFEENGIPLDGLTITNDVTESAGTLADYFTANPDTNAIFMLGPNPSSSLNLYLQESGRQPREIYATTHDTSAEIYQMIKDGYLVQAIDQQPYLQGFETIMWLYLNSQFALAPGGDILTGPGVIDGSNVDAIVELTAAGYR